MENREILVANTRTQRREKIVTNATTLGELKSALDAAHVDYTGMDFVEGITKTALLDDNTPLPRDVNYNGTTTNSLVIILSNSKKNIASGTGTRKEAYEIIKANGWKEDVEQEFGYNYTNVSTEDLWNFISNHVSTEGEEPGYEDDYDEEDDEDDQPIETSQDCEMEIQYTTLVDTLYTHIKMLVYQEVLSKDELLRLIAGISDIAKSLADKEERTIHVGDTSITDSDVDRMIAGIR